MESKIMREVYRAMEKLDAPIELLAIIGSFRDTLDDDEVLDLLRDYNAGRSTIEPFCPPCGECDKVQ